MNNMMKFPDTVEEFMEQYKITDTEQIYTNGTELVPIFRMKQWFEHLPSVEPEQKRGRWLKAYGEHEAMGIRPIYRYCSSCNEATVFETNYCPHCGSYNRGEQE